MMNIMTLIQRHPLLMADLRNLGLSHRHLDDMAENISTQLGGAPDFNLCYVLTALDCKEFIRSIDINAVAQFMKIRPSLAQSAVLTLAPWVGRFAVNAPATGVA